MRISARQLKLAQRLEDEFETFWAAYPEKKAKGIARGKFFSARRKASLEEILAGVERYKRSKPEDRSWKFPEGWLSGERWLDETETRGPEPSREQELSNIWMKWTRWQLGQPTDGEIREMKALGICPQDYKW